MEPDGIVALALAISLPVWLAIEELLHRVGRLQRHSRRSPVRAARRVVVQPRAA